MTTRTMRCLTVVLPLMSIFVAAFSVGPQVARCSRNDRDLKAASEEFRRLEHELPGGQTEAEALFAGTAPHDDSGMPHSDQIETPVTPVSDRGTLEDERRLFLTPGGVYTQADIAANGGVLPERKFAGLVAKHVMRVKPGDRLCPITNTLANPKFSWVVGGQTYQFCCPPCIREFVEQAKKQSKRLPEPETYVKR